MLLEGEVVILAGGTGRVGGATLATLLREGSSVLLLSRERHAAEDAVQRNATAEQRGRVAVLAVDLSSPEGGKAAVGEAIRCFGRIDAAVSLAGGRRFLSLDESNLDDLRANVEFNLYTTYNLMLPALSAMLAQEPRPGARSRGRLVAVSAGSSKDPQPTYALMGASKAAVNVLMQGIAREHKADRIVANALVLGTVATDAARGYLSREDFEAAASPEEVADVLAFLASDRSSGINGALVDLNAR
ncbi:MAG: SDR family oxidoreductase, partial [bacterium]|nr:SDR family oxidoreductase [bacterium]